MNFFLFIHSLIGFCRLLLIIYIFLLWSGVYILQQLWKNSTPPFENLPQIFTITKKKKVAWGREFWKNSPIHQWGGGNLKNIHPCIWLIMHLLTIREMHSSLQNEQLSDIPYYQIKMNNYQRFHFQYRGGHHERSF